MIEDGQDFCQGRCILKLDHDKRVTFKQQLLAGPGDLNEQVGDEDDGDQRSMWLVEAISILLTKTPRRAFGPRPRGL